MSKKAHFDPKSKKWIISLVIMVALSAVVIITAAKVNADKKADTKDPVTVASSEIYQDVEPDDAPAGDHAEQ